MLDKLIKFSDKIKETTDSGINEVRMGATIERESGNIKVISHFYVDVTIWSKLYKGKTVLSVSYFENTDGETLIGGEGVNEMKLIEHLNSIGLYGIANKLKNTIDSMSRYEDKDIAKALQNSKELKEHFKDFVIHDLMTEDERKEYREEK